MLLYTHHACRRDLLKEGRTIKSQLSHMWNFKELPEGGDLTVAGYDAVMKHAGVKAEQVNEGLAGAKGQLSARASRAKGTTK